MLSHVHYEANYFNFKVVSSKINIIEQFYLMKPIFTFFSEPSFPKPATIFILFTAQQMIFSSTENFPLFTTAFFKCWDFFEDLLAFVMLIQFPQLMVEDFSSQLIFLEQQTHLYFFKFAISNIDFQVLIDLFL